MNTEFLYHLILTTLYEVGFISIILQMKKSTFRKIGELVQGHVPYSPCSSCTSCNAGIIVAKTIYTSMEVRRRVTHPNTFLRGRRSLARENLVEGRASSRGYTLEDGWQIRGRHGSVEGGEVPASLIPSGIFSRWNSVTGWKE